MHLKQNAVNFIIQLAAIATGLLGLAYIIAPRAVHRYELKFASTSDEPSQRMIWVYRFLGIGLITISISHIV